ncbi:MAG TPA: hypothetical protein VF450_00175 [Noviherbaspirillum sp.]
MSANPFRKEDFSSYRIWEEALILFLLRQLQHPDVLEWLAVAEDAETRENAAFLSLHLANLAYIQHAKQEEGLRQVYETLMHQPPHLPAYRRWLSKRWIDYCRLTDALKYAIQHNVSPDTHRLVA